MHAFQITSRHAPSRGLAQGACLLLIGVACTGKVGGTATHEDAEAAPVADGSIPLDGGSAWDGSVSSDGSVRSDGSLSSDGTTSDRSTPRGDAPADSGGGGSEPDLCRAYDLARCTRAARCAERPGDVEVGECMVGLGDDCARRLSYVMDLVADGRAELDETGVRACFDALSSTSCWDREPQCLTQNLTPRTPLGESCRGSGECVGGYCRYGSSCPGTCTALVAGHGSCAAGDRCADGFACLAGRCQPRPRAGELCTSRGARCLEGLCQPVSGGQSRCRVRGATGQPCDVRDHCASLLCIDGRCAESADAGQPCTFPSHCAAPLVCADGDPGPGLDPRCRMPLPTGAECPGEGSCQAGNECLLQWTAGGTVRRCATLPGVGESCVERCGDGAYCPTVSDPSSRRVCRSLSGLGGSCQDGPVCSDGLFCDFASKRCRARSTVGAACSMDGVCREGLFCIDRVCLAPRGEGGSCYRGSHCESDYCVAGFCSSSCRY